MNTPEKPWNRKKSNPAAVLVICGPTACGKTELALHLARKAGGEIISADAFQFYRGLDIGTAKPTRKERQEVPHHFIDCLSPEEPANAHWYARGVRVLVSEIIRRGKLPLLVGGSGLYLKAVLEGFFEMPATADIGAARKELKGVASRELYPRLKAVDPVTASRLHPHDEYRLRRALEVYYAAGKPISALQRQSHPLPYHCLPLAIHHHRPVLYRRIEERVDRIFTAGFVSEVEELYRRYDFSLPAFAAIGYREIAACLRGEMSESEAREVIKRKTRNYAKRQLTWFKKEPRIWWLDFSSRPDL